MYNYSSWISETDPIKLNELFCKKIKHAGFTILKVVDYNFEPYGYTVIYLLAESHFAIHTFPEQGQTYIELVSCTKNPFDIFIAEMAIKP
jgi:S-adenosylmethionine decarboxylase